MTVHLIWPMYVFFPHFFWGVAGGSRHFGKWKITDPDYHKQGHITLMTLIWDKLEVGNIQPWTKKKKKIWPSLERISTWIWHFVWVQPSRANWCWVTMQRFCHHVGSSAVLLQGPWARALCRLCTDKYTSLQRTTLHISSHQNHIPTEHAADNKVTTTYQCCVYPTL